MKILLNYLFFTQFTFFIIGCVPKCEDPLTIGDAGFNFELHNKETDISIIGDKSLYPQKIKYDYRNINMLNENGDTLEDYKFYVLDTNMSLIVPDFPNIITGQKISKTYYLLLPDLAGNPNRHRDTLRFEYRFKEYECPAVWYDYFKVFYNDSLYHDGEFVDFMVFYE